MNFLLELLKITLPAIIVFLTVYFLFKKYLDSQLHMKRYDMALEQTKHTLPLKLQAYERLSLFCERISVPNLLLRLRTEPMSAGMLRYAMLTAIQQEFEYNITQQVYISEQLWAIIKEARNQTVNAINTLAEGIDKNSEDKELTSRLVRYADSEGMDPLHTALLAIKREAGQLLG